MLVDVFVLLDIAVEVGYNLWHGDAVPGGLDHKIDKFADVLV